MTGTYEPGGTHGTQLLRPNGWVLINETWYNLWELLRLLNWVAAPSTQHSAARTPWGPKWIHVLGYADTAGPVAIGPDLMVQLGLLPGYVPEYVEMQAVEKLGDAALTPNAIRDTAMSQEMIAPQGRVRIEPENLHTWLWPKIARAKSDGQFEILVEAKEWLKPLPYAAYPGQVCTAKGLQT